MVCPLGQPPWDPPSARAWAQRGTARGGRHLAACRTRGPAPSRRTGASRGPPAPGGPRPPAPPLGPSRATLGPAPRGPPSRGTWAGRRAPSWALRCLRFARRRWRSRRPSSLGACVRVEGEGMQVLSRPVSRCAQQAIAEPGARVGWVMWLVCSWRVPPRCQNTAFHSGGGGGGWHKALVVGSVSLWRRLLGGGGGMHQKGRDLRGGPRGGSIGGWRRLPKRLECRLQVPQKPPSGRQWLGVGWAPWKGGGGVPPPLPIHLWRGGEGGGGLEWVGGCWWVHGWVVDGLVNELVDGLLGGWVGCSEVGAWVGTKVQEREGGQTTSAKKEEIFGDMSQAPFTAVNTSTDCGSSVTISQVLLPVS